MASAGTFLSICPVDLRAASSVWVRGAALSSSGSIKDGAETSGPFPWRVEQPPASSRQSAAASSQQLPAARKFSIQFAIYSLLLPPGLPSAGKMRTQAGMRRARGVRPPIWPIAAINLFRRRRP